jgi:hypothetical protein
LSYSYLQNSTGSGNAPEGPLWTHTSHYETAGVAGNVVFNVLGAGHVTSPYLLAGAGLYAVHAASEYNSVIGPYWDNSTSAKLGYDFGFGIRVKSFFVEGRALQLRPIRGWGGDSPMLYSYPISAGFWF